MSEVANIAKKRAVVVKFSGGVTSAWCAGWALRNFPKEEIRLLWHDTKEEHPDTLRFLREMATKLDLPVIERSDGRSVTQVFYDEEFLGNNQNAMCSRILKQEPGDAYFAELLRDGYELITVFGFSGTAKERERIQRMQGYAIRYGYQVRFPVAETGTTKQECADWCNCVMGVAPSAMYEDFGHANCIGCVKGGRAYWLKVAEKFPDVFSQRADLEEEFGHSILRGELRKGETRAPFLRELVKIGLKRRVVDKEAITLGPCECGD